jgi:hypothetical protein
MNHRSRRRTLVTGIAVLGVGLTVVAGQQIEDSGRLAEAAAAPNVVATGALAATPTAARVSTISQVIDSGPVTFPATLARGQAAMGTFRTAVASPLGPAVKFLHPGGAWSGHDVSVMWLSHVALKLSLHPGVWTNYSSVWDPGYSRYWTQPAVLSPAKPFQVGLAATFNGGFKLSSGDSRGGYWDYGARLGGHGIGPGTGGAIVSDPTGRRSLVTGAASLVIYRNGTWSMGRWNREVGMSTQTAYVRQELTPLIDNGVVNPLTKNPNCQTYWGKTLRGLGCTPWRSGVGITAIGDLVYASGNYLNPFQLAVILRQAGAVRAMQLDINPEWISAEFYRDTAAGAIPYAIRTTYYGKAHYIVGSVAAGTAVNRDFFAAYLR